MLAHFLSSFSALVWKRDNFKIWRSFVSAVAGEQAPSTSQSDEPLESRSEKIENIYDEDDAEVGVGMVQIGGDDLAKEASASAAQQQNCIIA